MPRQLPLMECWLMLPVKNKSYAAGTVIQAQVGTQSGGQLIQFTFLDSFIRRILTKEIWKELAKYVWWNELWKYLL